MKQANTTNQQTKKTATTRLDFAIYFNQHQRTRASKQQKLQTDINSQLNYKQDRWPPLLKKIKELIPKISRYNSIVLPHFKNEIFTPADHFKLYSPIYLLLVRVSTYLKVLQSVSIVILAVKMIVYCFMLPVYFVWVVILLTIQLIKNYWLRLISIVVGIALVYLVNEIGLFNSLFI